MTEGTGRGRRFPLVLPEESLPIRSRPSVTEADLGRVEAPSRTRPPVDPKAVEAEDHEVYEGRITGKKHSITATAAPLRIRQPEKEEAPRTSTSPAKKNAAAGTRKKEAPPVAPKPPRKQPVSVEKPPQKPKKTESAVPSKGAKAQQKGKKPLNRWILAAICVLLLAAVGLAAFQISSLTHPAPPDETTPTETDVVETFPKETDPVETVSKETEPAETTPPETEPTETDAPETVYVRYSVTVEAFGKAPVSTTTGTISVGELLRVLGFELSHTDRPSVSTDTMIESDMVIVIDHVEYKTEQVISSIPYTTEEREVQTIPRGETKVIQQGVDGEKTVNYQVEYINGVESSRTAAGETVTKEMLPHITEVGVGGEFVGADGKTYTFSYMRVVSASYYNIEGSTWLGHDASENTVAANLNNLPLGTKLYVKNGEYDFGPRTVEDTGGTEGYDILLWIPKNSPLLEAFAENRQLDDVVIYYLD